MRDYSSASLWRKVSRAGVLQSSVRMVKRISASSIEPYESAVVCLDECYRTVRQFKLHHALAYSLH